MKQIIIFVLYHFFISCSSFPLDDVSELKNNNSEIHSDGTMIDSNLIPRIESTRARSNHLSSVDGKSSESLSKSHAIGRDPPEVMAKLNYNVGDSGILLGNHLYATQGRTPNHLNVYHIQDDNFVKDAIAKYFEFEVYLFQTGFESPRKGGLVDSTSQNQTSTHDLKYHLFRKPNKKETSKFTSNADDSETFTHPVAITKNSKASQHTDDPRQTSLTAFLPDDNKPRGPKIIESKIHAKPNSVTSDHTNIQATDGHTHTEFMVKSYQTHGYYKNADVDNVVISNGITAVE